MPTQGLHTVFAPAARKLLNTQDTERSTATTFASLYLPDPLFPNENINLTRRD
jgi:hypothetical protein